MSNFLSSSQYHHVSVLFEESVAILNPEPGSILVDCTLGGGGHTKLMLEKVGPTGRVVSFDRDIVAIENASVKFAKEISEERLALVHAPFGDIFSEIKKLGLVGKIQGVLADIGVSSHHLDVAERGFSFMNEGPLDMRMDQRSGQSAAEFLATAEEADIAHVIWKFGEEPKSRFIAKLICETRKAKPFQSTKDLANLIASKVFWKEASRKHPATRTFQALRIFVNDELGQLETLLADAPKTLKIGGILAIISFHSLEDRIVKEAMQGLSGKTKREAIPRDLPFTHSEISKMTESNAEIIKPFPISPTDNEIAQNPRARSAKLRAIRLTRECSIMD